MSKIYVILETHGGYGQSGSVHHCTLDTDVLDTICKLDKPENKAELSLYVGEQIDKCTDKNGFVGTLYWFFSSDFDGKEMRKAYKKNKEFGGITEEFCYGAAPTKNCAKALFADALAEAAENECMDDWDED